MSRVTTRVLGSLSQPEQELVSAIARQVRLMLRVEGYRPPADDRAGALDEGIAVYLSQCLKFSNRTGRTDDE